jgi:hypothetical protein
MLKDIIEYLYQFKDSKWHSINDFLIEKHGTEDVAELRKALVKLHQSNRIEIKEEEHLKLDSNSRINPSDYQNTYRDLSNLNIEAKLSHEEREKLDLIEAAKPKNEIPLVMNARRIELLSKADEIIKFITLPEHIDTKFSEKDLSNKFSIPYESFVAIREAFLNAGYIEKPTYADGDGSYVVVPTDKARALFVTNPEISVFKPKSKKSKFSIFWKYITTHPALPFWAILVALFIGFWPDIKSLFRKRNTLPIESKQESKKPSKQPVVQPDTSHKMLKDSSIKKS